MAVMSNEKYDTGYILHQLFRASRNLGLTAGEFEVLAAMVAHDCPDDQGQRKGEVWCSPKNGLHDLTGRPSRTAQRVLKSLAEKGAITNLTPGNNGGGQEPNVWRINYRILGWKEFEGPVRQSGSSVRQFSQSGTTNCHPNLDHESGKEPPPQSPPPSYQSSAPAEPQLVTTGPQTEEEEGLSCLDPDEPSLLGELRLSQAGWRMVDDAAPDLLQQALRHIESSRTEIEAAGFSREQRLGAILKGAFVLPEEPEMEPKLAKGNGSKMLFCSFCGTVYSGEGHECTER